MAFVEHPAFFTFGVQCGGMLVLGGQAMQHSTPPFDSVDLAVDGRSFGRFDVQNGLNDVFVLPTAGDGSQDWALIRPALMAGRVLHVTPTGGSFIEFALTGSGRALQLLDIFCGPAAS